MTTQVTKTVLVNVPVSRAYNQWTQFEEFPRFMGGVKSVTQLADDRLDWVAEIAGVRRRWEARILEQLPDRKVAWAATEGATNAGTVTFEDLGGGQTSVNLLLEYEPEGLVEKAGDAMHLIERQAQADLDRFKEFIESEEYATGAWRGAVTSDGGTSVRQGSRRRPPPAATTAKPACQARPSRLVSAWQRPPPPPRWRQPRVVPEATPRPTRLRRSTPSGSRRPLTPGALGC